MNRQEEGTALRAGVHPLIRRVQAFMGKAHFSDLTDHPVHPWYGPCDASGPKDNCAECQQVVKVLAFLIATTPAANAADLPSSNV
jgi:hypothetical protein